MELIAVSVTALQGYVLQQYAQSLEPETSTQNTNGKPWLGVGISVVLLSGLVWLLQQGWLE
ncbi:hypothetical protein ADP71_27460 [Vitreoscilla sp. C1]|nr:hypothetical protein ADP71_27460 [Vitreoscilla sp. C1]